MAKGRFNPKTGKYIYKGVEIDSQATEDEIEELQYQKIEQEGGTYLERFAKELNVPQGALLQNILTNNTLERFNSIKTYDQFRMLKQTLVEDIRPKELAEAYDTIDLYTKGFYR